MKIALVTGSYPPDVCGVSDYTEMLGNYLRLNGLDIQIYTGRDWRLRSALKNSMELVRMGIDIVHMQYPTTGYGWNLGPQAMAIALPMVLTLHEVSQSHLLRKFSLYPFSVRAQKIIFTNEFEKAYAQRFAPWITRRSLLIPIGNNVPVVPYKSDGQGNWVTYFGLIRPDKGLEEVLELARLLKDSRRRIRIVGRLMPGYEDYYEKLRAQGEPFYVDWQIGLSGDALSTVLATSDIAYLPFPDGASERRSSLIATLANAAAVVTTRGSHTPEIMHNAVLFAESPADAARLVARLDRNPEQKSLLQQKALQYAKRFEWEDIATQHVLAYEDVLQHAKSPG